VASYRFQRGARSRERCLYRCRRLWQRRARRRKKSRRRRDARRSPRRDENVRSAECCHARGAGSGAYMSRHAGSRWCEMRCGTRARGDAADTVQSGDEILSMRQREQSRRVCAWHVLPPQAARRRRGCGICACKRCSKRPREPEAVPQTRKEAARVRQRQPPRAASILPRRDICGSAAGRATFVAPSLLCFCL